MNPAERENFAEMLTAVHDIYAPTRKLDGMVIAIYWSALQAFDLAAVRQAFDRHVKNPDTGQFMPKPADLIRMMSGSTRDSALVAWAKVDAAVRRVGPHRDVAFDDPIIHRVLNDMGGWMALGNKTEDDWPFVAKEFENRYRGFRERGETPDYPAVLIGSAGSDHRRLGKTPPPPMLIGDKAAATAVFVGGTDKPLIGITRADEHLSPGMVAPRLKG